MSAVSEHPDLAVAEDMAALGLLDKIGDALESAQVTSGQIEPACRLEPISPHTRLKQTVHAELRQMILYQQPYGDRLHKCNPDMLCQLSQHQMPARYTPKSRVAIPSSSIGPVPSTDCCSLCCGFMQAFTSSDCCAAAGIRVHSRTWSQAQVAQPLPGFMNLRRQGLGQLVLMQLWQLLSEQMSCLSPNDRQGDLGELCG
eukprot:GHUV01032245.1.p1 GENE.GHUV01032245.1~~GHUV01032245.1.p1  ORF type:complete len:200 (+),score=27.95 GHUV01032245.1:222-821(+)